MWDEETETDVSRKQILQEKKQAQLEQQSAKHGMRPMKASPGTFLGGGNDDDRDGGMAGGAGFRRQMKQQAVVAKKAPVLPKAKPKHRDAVGTMGDDLDDLDDLMGGAAADVSGH